jgi:DNA polymerase-3 subunit gamma/tau
MTQAESSQQSQALARKWRPRNFESLVGQDHVVRALSHALENQRLHHAYLFTGTRGVGKTTIARILARAVNCERGISKNPCGVCQACVEISQGRFVDLLEVDAATNTRVDEMRALLENAMYAPTAGRYKVYVIDEVHMLSTSAFNAMLKTLEEPPGHVLFILATTDPQKIPATVLSRCLQFGLRNLGPDVLSSHLGNILDQEGVSYEPAALRLLAKAARGSVRDALSLTDQAIAYSAGCVQEVTVRQMLGSVDQHVVLQILQALQQGDGKTLLSIAQHLAGAGAPFAAILDELALVAYRLSVAAFAGGLDPEDPDHAPLLDLQQAFHPEDLQLIYQIATHARAELHLAPEESVGFSMALVRMLAFKPSGVSGAAVWPQGGTAPAVQNAPRPMPSVSKPLVASPLPPASKAPPPPREPVPQRVEPAQPPRVVPPVAQPSSPPVVQTELASSAPYDGPLPTVDDWPTVSQTIPAKGLTRQALVQAELVSAQREGDRLEFVLRTAIKPYTEAAMVQRLEALLVSHYGTNVKLTVLLGDAVQTAHVVQTENRKQALEQAKQALADDPVLKDIQQLMGATIVPGSERTLSNVGPADV